MSARQGFVVALLALAVLTPVVAAAQATAPRTPWGDPDLGGVWDFRTLTPLERPEAQADREFLTEEEVAEIERGAEDTNRTADAAEAVRTEAGGNVGAYNRFWLDFGTNVVEDGRTSLVVDPPNGRRPPKTPEGEARPGFGGSFGTGPFEQVEDLNYFDRCIGSAALPIYPTAYNNNVQLFQTPDHVAMFVEMMGSTRIIPLDRRPHGEIRQWLGDSRGHWEGDTLVVETTNFDRALLLIGGSRDARLLVERFTRVGDVIEYSFTVDDPTTWTAPWTAVQSPAKDRRAAVRVRVPRGQLRRSQHTRRRPTGGGGRGLWHGPDGSLTGSRAAGPNRERLTGSTGSA